MAAAAQGSETSGSRGRVLAAIACALALALLTWRGAALITAPGAPVSASPDEAALADVLAPVAGPGLMRVGIAWNETGGRTLLILIDDAATPRRADIERLAPIAAGLVPERGDRLVIETVAFAPGLPGRPGAAAWTELAALLALLLCCAALAISPPRAARAPATQILAAPAPAPEAPRAAVRPLRPVPAPAPDAAAADLARRDPARAAAVVRGWLQGRDDTP